MVQVNKFTKRSLAREGGQASVFLMLAIGIFLLGGIGLAVDMSNLWMHRQSAQNAADAACTAAALDMVADGGGASSAGGFSPGTSFKCSGTHGAGGSTSNSSYSPCQYAAMNGYGASGLTTGSASTEVNVDFPASVPGVPACTGSTTGVPVCYDTTVSPHPFVRVTVTDRMQSFFVALLSGKHTMDTGAMASCGAVLSNAPIPLLILNPTLANTFTGDGTMNIKIVGGPNRSIQVDSSNSGATNYNGSGVVDLSHGGNGLNGSDFGNTSTETQAAAGGTIEFGTLPGQWRASTPPISDPFASTPAPGQPTFTTPAVVYGDTSANFGCPDTTDGCDHYKPGLYPNGIHIEKGKDATGAHNGSATGLAVFEPGIYYVKSPGLSADSNSCVRPSTAKGDGSGGTLFYFAGTGSTLNVTSNSGSLVLKSGSTTNFDCQDVNGTGGINNAAWAVSLANIRCIATGSPGATVLPANVVTFGGLVGNVLLGPCNAPDSTTGLCAPNCTDSNGNPLNYGDPLGASDPLGEQRGMLFFQDRSVSAAAPLWGGGGAFGLAGIMYFHNTASFNDQLTLGGNSTQNTFVVGDIIVDELNLHGTPALEMDLNPNALYYVLRASLLQ